MIGDKYHVKNRTLVMSQALDRNAPILHIRKICVGPLAKVDVEIFLVDRRDYECRPPIF